MIFNKIYDILNNYTNLRQSYILKLAKKLHLNTIYNHFSHKLNKIYHINASNCHFTRLFTYQTIHMLITVLKLTFLTSAKS